MGYVSAQGLRKIGNWWGGVIFLYLCLQIVKIIDLKEFNDAEHVYLNVSPPVIDVLRFMILASLRNVLCWHDR